MKLTEKKAARLRGGLAALALVSAPVSAGEVVVSPDSETWRIEADAATLREILVAVADKAGLEVFSTAPLDDVVSLRLSHASIPMLVRRLLRGESYVLAGYDGHYSLWIHGDGVRGQALHIARHEVAPESWDSAIDGLGSVDPERRVDAVYALADIDAPASVDLLRASLRDDDAEVQHAAIEVLAEAGAISVLRESWPHLAGARRIDVIDAVGDSDGAGRLEFLEFVAGLDDPGLSETALQYLEEPAWR